MSDHKNLFKDAGVVSSFTLLSRILGFIRDIIFAYAFGTGIAAQAFLVAFRIPNMLRDLIGEGAANAAIIPVLSEYRLREKSEDFWELVRTVFYIASLLLTVVVLVGIVAAPLLVRLIAYGFAACPEKYELTIILTRWLFPFIFFIGLSAHAMGVLQTLKHFSTPAAGSCVLNLTMIVFLLLICPHLPEPIFGLAAAVLLGGFLQLLLMAPPLYQRGMRMFPLPERFRHPDAMRIGTLLVPRMLGSSIYQLSIIVDTFFASLSYIVGDGAVAALYIANRLIQFPTALFGTAVATAVLPLFARQAVANDMNRMKQTLQLSARSLLILLIPCGVGLWVLSGPIVRLLFEHGKFDAAASAMTQKALMFYCLGMVAFSGARLVTSCFYALHDTLTPLKITLFSLAVNIGCNILFLRPLQVGGPPLSTAISSTVNMILLLVVLRRKIGPLGLSRISADAAKVLCLSLGMGLLCHWTYGWMSRQVFPQVLNVTGAIFVGVGFYFLVAWRGGLFKKILWHMKR